MLVLANPDLLPFWVFLDQEKIPIQPSYREFWADNYCQQVIKCFCYCRSWELNTQHYTIPEANPPWNTATSCMGQKSGKKEVLEEQGSPLKIRLIQPEGYCIGAKAGLSPNSHHFQSTWKVDTRLNWPHELSAGSTGPLASSINQSVTELEISLKSSDQVSISASQTVTLWRPEGRFSSQGCALYGTESRMGFSITGIKKKQREQGSPYPDSYLYLQLERHIFTPVPCPGLRKESREEFLPLKQIFMSEIFMLILSKTRIKATKELWSARISTSQSHCPHLHCWLKGGWWCSSRGFVPSRDGTAQVEKTQESWCSTG